MKVSRYKKEFEYSYALGAQPALDLLLTRPEDAVEVYMHSSFTGKERVEEICREGKIPVYYDDRVFARLSDRENCYVIGVFKKFDCELAPNKPHVLLVNPADMGNLGSVIRTLAGFGIYDLGILSPCADVFNPKTVRASMGAVFKVRSKEFSSVEEYRQAFSDRQFFSFMLEGKLRLGRDRMDISENFTLVFGNEATGLDKSYLEIGKSVFIPQTKDVDSLNLALSVGIGAFWFMNAVYDKNRGD